MAVARVKCVSLLLAATLCAGCDRSTTDELAGGALDGSAFVGESGDPTGSDAESAEEVRPQPGLVAGGEAVHDDFTAAETEARPPFVPEAAPKRSAPGVIVVLVVGGRTPAWSLAPADTAAGRREDLLTMVQGVLHSAAAGLEAPR